MAAPASQRLTPQKITRFLTVLAETGNVRTAASHATVSTVTLYARRKTHPAFATAWDDALASAMDLVLEPEATRRAVVGVLEPIYYQGAKVGTVRKYSDRLLIFLLKGGKPEKYKEVREDRQHVTLTVQLEDRLTKALSQMEATRNGHGHGHVSTPHP